MGKREREWRQNDDTNCSDDGVGRGAGDVGSDSTDWLVFYILCVSNSFPTLTEARRSLTDLRNA